MEIKRIGAGEGARNLRAMMDGFQLKKLLGVSLVVAVLMVLPSLAIKREAPPDGVLLLAGGVAAILGARLWYRLHPDSLKALFILKDVSFLPMMFGVLAATWEGRFFTGIQWLYTAYVPYYLLVFIAVWAGTAGWLIRRGVHLRRIYESLGAHLPRGTITDHELGLILWPHQASFGSTMAKMGIATGFATAGGLLAAGFGCAMASVICSFCSFW